MPQENSSPPPAGDKPFRLFIAIPLPDDIRQKMAELSRNLQKGIQFTPSHPTWSNIDGVHLTLAFLGNKAPRVVEPIGRMMDEVCADYAPLLIEIKRLGVFPHWRNPRVLWAGTRDRTRQIQALRKILEQRLTWFGYEPEAREFHPHLTLARFKSPKGATAAEGVVISHQDYKISPFEAPELVLFRSVLHPAGAQYMVMHQARLAAARAAADLGKK